MSTPNPYSQYVENQVLTATPGKLLVLAHDAAIRFGRQAQSAMSERKLDVQSTNIGKMQNILVELMGSLDPKTDPQLAANLDALYTYMFDRLTHANVRDDQQALIEVINIFTELRATWAEAEMSVRTGVPAEERQELKVA